MNESKNYNLHTTTYTLTPWIKKLLFSTMFFDYD